MKLYKLGLVIGRFQTLHLGHVSIISHALEICEQVVVYIGSAQESNTQHNPFSYNIRRTMLERAFPIASASKQLLIKPLVDISVGNNENWGKYVLDTFEEDFHRQPDLYVTGCEKERTTWFSEDIAPNMDELRITRTGINVSATECRELMLKNNYEEWCKLVPTTLYDSYEYLRNALLDVYEGSWALENTF